MRCPLCRQSKPTIVVSSRQQDDGSVARRRECRNCGVRWNTCETIISEPQRKAVELPPPEPGTVDCHHCQQWSTRHQACGLGFPEGHVQPSFAADCLHYQPDPPQVAAAA